MNNFLMSVSPHITSKRTTRNIMQDVCIALLPAVLVAVLNFGFYPLVVTIVSVLSAVGAEWLFCKIRKQPSTIGDFSAVVTGLLLALNLPPVLPLYVPIVGSVVAIMLVKMLFGGIGRNFANPAIAARIFLVLAWGTVMGAYVAPISLSNGFSEMFKYFSVDTKNVATIASATPMSFLKLNQLQNVNVMDMFLGRIGGSMGETSALALMVGGAYLIARKVINFRIPLIYILTVGVLTCLFKKDISYFLPSIFGGGLMLGAFFMATDYTTSPNTKMGIYIYSLGLGLLTVLIRELGALPEGVSFAILLMNIATPLLDKYLVPKWFGFVKAVKEKKTAKEAK